MEFEVGSFVKHEESGLLYKVIAEDPISEHMLLKPWGHRDEKSDEPRWRQRNAFVPAQNPCEVTGLSGKKDLHQKPHMASMDPFLILEMGIGMRFGVNKHGLNNHRLFKVKDSQEILDSIYRHLYDYLTGTKLDKEQQINNLACVVNNIHFLYRLDRLFGYENVIDAIYGETR